MIRYLIIAAALYLAGALLRRLWRQLQQSDTSSQQPAQSDTSEATARCAHCGVFVPRSQALMSGQHYYCSAEHQQQAADQERS